MAGISKTAGINASLLSVQKVTKAANQAQTALSSGRKVNSATDNAFAFFVAKSLSGRAGDLAAKKDGIDQGISAIRTATNAIDTIEDFSKQLKGLAEAARSASPAERQALTEQFNEVARQIDNVAQDASFGGVNLVSGNDELTVSFDSREASNLTVEGADISGDDLTALGAPGGSLVNATNDDIDAIISQIDDSIDSLRGQAAQLGTQTAILQERADFTDAQVNELQAGADKLTLADLNEEAALSVAAQTRQQIGINSISIAGNQQRAILDLIGGN